MEEKNSSPSWIWYDAATVVREGLMGCEKGRSIVISGRLYRWLDPLLRSTLFRGLLLKIAAAVELFSSGWALAQRVEIIHNSRRINELSKDR